MTESQETKSSTSIIDIIRRLIALQLDTAKLTVAEKLSLLLSGIALFTIIMVFTVIALIFIAIGIANMLEEFIAPFWTYFIIAGLLTLLIVTIVLLKDKVITDPIARFISRLIINPPKK